MHTIAHAINAGPFASASRTVQAVAEELVWRLAPDDD